MIDSPRITVSTMSRWLCSICFSTASTTDRTVALSGLHQPRGDAAPKRAATGQVFHRLRGDQARRVAGDAWAGMLRIVGGAGDGQLPARIVGKLDSDGVADLVLIHGKPIHSNMISSLWVGQAPLTSRYLSTCIACRTHPRR